VTAPIPENRPLTADKGALVQWRLEHGNQDAARFLPQLTDVSVVSRCPCGCGCGCASIDFAVGGAVPPAGAGMQILADFQWQAADGAHFGVFVFAEGGLLAGLEVWSVDGSAVASVLPAIGQLQPLVFSQREPLHGPGRINIDSEPGRVASDDVAS
jgi:hypothetical protein